LHGLERNEAIICGCAFCRARPVAVFWLGSSTFPGKVYLCSA